MADTVQRHGSRADGARPQEQPPVEIAIIASVLKVKHDRGIEQGLGGLRAPVIDGGGNRSAGRPGKDDANVAAAGVLRQHGKLEQSGAVVGHVESGGRSRGAANQGHSGQIFNVGDPGGNRDVAIGGEQQIDAAAGAERECRRTGGQHEVRERDARGAEVEVGPDGVVVGEGGGVIGAVGDDGRAPIAGVGPSIVAALPRPHGTGGPGGSRPPGAHHPNQTRHQPGERAPHQYFNHHCLRPGGLISCGCQTGVRVEINSLHAAVPSDVCMSRHPAAPGAALQYGTMLPGGGKPICPINDYWASNRKNCAGAVGSTVMAVL